MKKKLTFEDLENELTQESLNAAQELWDMAEELPQIPEPVSLNKEYKMPDDELAYEIFLALPQTFPFRNKQWSKNEFAHHCNKHKINLNDLTLMKQIDAEIKENINSAAMEVDDDIFNDLLALKSTPSETEEETIEVQPIKEEKKEDTLQTILNELQSLKDRVSILEEENRLLKEINKSLKKEEPLKKSTTQINDNLSAQDIIASYHPTPKKRRGRPAGYKTSQATKEKQRAARLKKIKEKDNNETTTIPQSSQQIPLQHHNLQKQTPIQRRNDFPNPQTGNQKHQPSRTPLNNPHGTTQIKQLERRNV